MKNTTIKEYIKTESDNLRDVLTDLCIKKAGLTASDISENGDDKIFDFVVITELAVKQYTDDMLELIKLLEHFKEKGLMSEHTFKGSINHSSKYFKDQAIDTISKSIEILSYMDQIMGL